MHRRLGAPALAIAAGGVLAGHLLTYVVVRPEHHERATLLAATGHGYLGAALEVAMLAAAVAAATVFLGRLLRPGEPRSLPWLAPRLAATQIVAFGALEVAERAVAGTADGLPAVLLVGGAVQGVLALLASWLVRRLERGAAATADLLGRAATLAADRAGRTIVVPPAMALPGGGPGAASIRGPPPGR